MINLCLTALIPRGQRLDFNSSNLGSPSAWLEKARVGRPAKGSQYTRHQNASRPSPGGDAATADAQALDRGQDGVRYHVSDADACPCIELRSQISHRCMGRALLYSIRPSCPYWKGL